MMLDLPRTIGIMVDEVGKQHWRDDGPASALRHVEIAEFALVTNH
jgi:hypothetical protein